jgi:predicted PurR-regulated permease PerM
MEHHRATRFDLAAWLLAALVLVLVLLLDLLPALLAGLLVYELTRMLAPKFRPTRMRRMQGRIIAVVVLAVIIVLLLILAVLGMIAAVKSMNANLPVLMQKMADVIDGMKARLPEAIVQKLPADVDELKVTTSNWLRTNAGSLGHMGMQAVRVLIHILVGFFVGALVALHDVHAAHDLGPLGHAMQERASRLGTAFRRVVFSQVRISAINTALTALYLIVALPLFGVHLPLATTMVIVTFCVGLLPVLGNLISNSIILTLSLSVSGSVALASLVFLVIIHKLEYFLNAHIVGTQVHAHAWELLLAMLVMETAFGIPGLIAAPVYYAYIKNEMVSQKLV